jgi:hypothetical protein
VLKSVEKQASLEEKALVGFVGSSKMAKAHPFLDLILIVIQSFLG